MSTPSASSDLMRAMMASTMPVRGDPVSPSKNKTFHPFARHHPARAALLALSVLLARYRALRRVAHALLARLLLETNGDSGIRALRSGPIQRMARAAHYRSWIFITLLGLYC